MSRYAVKCCAWIDNTVFATSKAHLFEGLVSGVVRIKLNKGGGGARKVVLHGVLQAESRKWHDPSGPPTPHAPFILKSFLSGSADFGALRRYSAHTSMISTTKQDNV